MASTHPPPADSGLCSNCGAPLGGPYCSACGQHQRDLDRPFRELAAEALAGFVAFDERLLRTLRLLVRRPGELTLDYLRGRRARYAHPFRLYFALSVLLFLVLGWSGFTLVNVTESDNDRVVTAIRIGGGTPTTGAVGDSSPTSEAGVAPPSEAGPTPSTSTPTTEEAPAGAADRRGPLTRMLVRLGEIYEDDPARLNRAFTDRLATSVIVLVPAFALLLRLLYRRTRYVAHLVFSLHLHSFAFLVLVIGIGADLLLGRAERSGGPGAGLAQLAIAVHAFLALRRVHRQGRILTVLKMVALLLGYLVPFLLTMIATLAVTVALA